jgi:hypothetical protein
MIVKKYNGINLFLNRQFYLLNVGTSYIYYVTFLEYD